LSQIISFIHKIRTNRELLLVTLSQVVGLLSSILFIKLVSHYAAVEEYGLYSLVLSIAAFIALFPFTSFDQAISRYISIYHEDNNYHANYTSILFLYFLLITALLILFAIFYPFLKPFIPDDILNVFDVLIIFSVLTIFRTTILQIENFNRNRMSVLYSRIFEGVTRILLLIFLVLYSSVSAYKILWIASIIFIVNIVWILFYRRALLTPQGLKLNLLKTNFKNYYRFSAPLLIWAVFSWLQLYAASWFLQYYRSVEEVGYFTLLNTIALIVPAQVVGIIGTFIVPIMYQTESTRNRYTREKTKEIAIYLALFFILIFVFMLFFHSFIVEILSSSKYVAYSWLLPYLFLAAAFSNIAIIWTYEFFVHKKTKQLLLAQILPAFISILSCYFLIPVYGIIGATVALLLTSVSYFILVVSTYYKFFTQLSHIKPNSFFV